jgi:hypothetical protein
MKKTSRVQSTTPNQKVSGLNSLLYYLASHCDGKLLMPLHVLKQQDLTAAI